jgi:hypothetical protein
VGHHDIIVDRPLSPTVRFPHQQHGIRKKMITPVL